MVEFIRNIFAPEKRLQYSIAALLDDEHTRIVQDIWHELDNQLGIKHPYLNAIPHITHVQADKLEQPAFNNALRKFAQAQAPFIVRTVGLGLFTGEKNALYISVVRNPEITAVQTNLITYLASSMEGIRETHYVNHWLPHISLMIPGMGQGKIGRVIDLLALRDFTWEFRVRKLIVLDGSNNANKSPFIVELTGGRDG